jgi:hypothetical protein
MLLSMAFSPSQTSPARHGSKIGCLRKCSSPIVLRFPWPLVEPNDFTYVGVFKHFLYSKVFNGGVENSIKFFFWLWVFSWYFVFGIEIEIFLSCCKKRVIKKKK